MNERALEFQRRTKPFALDLIRLVDGLPRSTARDVIGRQLVRSGTSVAANYRSACRARSPADFVAKLGIVEEEADESQLWLEMLGEAQLMRAEALASLVREADEIVRVVAASRMTARRRMNQANRQSSIVNRQ